LICPPREHRYDFIVCQVHAIGSIHVLDCCTTPRGLPAVDTNRGCRLLDTYRGNRRWFGCPNHPVG
jgi:hypothetical protein